jgi:hypothetical protein
MGAGAQSEPHRFLYRRFKSASRSSSFLSEQAIFYEPIRYTDHIIPAAGIQEAKDRNGPDGNNGTCRDCRGRDATRAKLAERCRKVVAEGPDAERPFAARVLVSIAISWNRLTDDERKKLFLSSNPSAWRWMELALSKNGKREELMEWAREQPAEDLLV